MADRRVVDDGYSVIARFDGGFEGARDMSNDIMRRFVRRTMWAATIAAVAAVGRGAEDAGGAREAPVTRPDEPPATPAAPDVAAAATAPSVAAPAPATTVPSAY